MDDSLYREKAVVVQIGQDDQYDFSHKRRGVAVIIINDKDQIGILRKGSENDLKNFQEVFLYLGFDVRIFKNKRKEELLESLKTVSEENHSDCDCFILAISSHGDELECNRVREDLIHTLDDTIKTREIIEKFTDEACQSLAGKPRLVFIQACRGNKLDDGQDVCYLKTSQNKDVPDSAPMHRDSTDAAPVNILTQHAMRSKQLNAQQHVYHDPVSKNSTYHHSVIQKTQGGRVVLQHQDRSLKPVVSPAPCYKDFVVMYATPPGYYAFRRPEHGSWFVNCLAEVLLKCDGQRSFLRELTQVTGKVATNYISSHEKPSYSAKKQTPVIYSMLCKDIFMIPKSAKK